MSKLSLFTLSEQSWRNVLGMRVSIAIWSYVTMAVSSLILMGCDDIASRSAPSDAAYLSGGEIGVVDVWSIAPGGYQTLDQYGQPPAVLQSVQIPQGTTKVIGVLERQWGTDGVLKEVYFKIRSADPEIPLGWVARPHVFINEFATYYYEHMDDRTFSTSEAYSIPPGEDCTYALIPVFKDQLTSFPKDTYETTAQYEERKAEARNKAATLFETIHGTSLKKTLVVFMNEKFKYDADNQRYVGKNGEYFVNGSAYARNRESLRQKKHVLNGRGCSYELGYDLTKVSTGMVINDVKSPLLAQGVPLTIEGIDPARAKQIDQGSKYNDEDGTYIISIFGFHNLSNPQYSRPGTPCDFEYCSSHRTYYDADYAYHLLYDDFTKKVLKAFIDPNYEDKLVVDIQVQLLRNGFEVGHVNGDLSSNAEFRGAIELAKANGLIGSKTDVGIEMLAQLLDAPGIKTYGDDASRGVVKNVSDLDHLPKLYGTDK